MRGSSARSLAAVLAEVDRAVADGADADQLGADLFSVVGLLDVQPALRRVLTDPSSPDAAKAGLASQLLGAKIGDAASGVVALAVQSRWSRGRDLSDGLEQAGVAAHVAGADEAGSLDAVEDELFRFGRIVAGDPELRSVLTDRAVPVPARQKLVGDVLADKVTDPTRALALQAVRSRDHGFERTLADFGELAASRRERLVATVRVADGLPDDALERLVAALSSQYGRDVHANVVVDPSVIGGVAVEIGDEIIDGTVATKLADARRRMAG